jgi:hypothetical protein
VVLRTASTIGTSCGASAGDAESAVATMMPSSLVAAWAF